MQNGSIQFSPTLDFSTPNSRPVSMALHPLEPLPVAPPRQKSPLAVPEDNTAVAVQALLQLHNPAHVSSSVSFSSRPSLSSRCSTISSYSSTGCFLAPSSSSPSVATNDSSTALQQLPPLTDMLPPNLRNNNDTPIPNNNNNSVPEPSDKKSIGWLTHRRKRPTTDTEPSTHRRLMRTVSTTFRCSAWRDETKPPAVPLLQTRPVPSQPPATTTVHATATTTKRRPRWQESERLGLFNAVVQEKQLDDMASFRWDRIAMMVGRAKKACKDQWRREVLPALAKAVKGSSSRENSPDC